MVLLLNEGETEERLHKQTQEMIAELGELLGNISKKEYPLPYFGYERRVDVVWKKNEESNPFCAFEIHVKGDLDRSITILKQAHTKWNSTPLLVTTDDKDIVNRAKRLLESSSPELMDRLEFMTRKEVSERILQAKGLVSFANRIDYKIVLRSRKFMEEKSRKEVKDKAQ